MLLNREKMFLKKLILFYIFFVNTEKWNEIFSKDEREKGKYFLF